MPWGFRDGPMGDLKKLLCSFRYALRGIGYAICTQRNLRIHLTAVAVVVIFNAMARLSVIHWCMEILCCMVVIGLELVNTALEQACDAITTEQHAGIGHAKDAAAGAVLAAAIGSVIVAALIFFRGDPAYLENITRVWRHMPWVKYMLMLGAIAALAFIFLPSALQTRKRR